MLAFNTLRPRQNGRHFPDGIFKWIFLNENVWISINIPLKCLFTDNVETYVEWHREFKVKFQLISKHYMFLVCRHDIDTSLAGHERNGY